MSKWVNVGGTWRQVVGQWANVGGTWRQITNEWVNVGGTWRQSYASSFQAPASITAINNSTSTPAILINWSASTSGSNSVTYDLYKSTSSTPAPTSSTAASSGLGGISGTSENNTGGLTFGTTYYYWVRAVDSTGAKTAWTGPASATPAALSAGLTPSLSITSSTSTGFTVYLSNYDATYTWGISITSGSGSISPSTITGNGSYVVTTSGTATITVTTAKSGYSSGTSSISGSASVFTINTLTGSSAGSFSATWFNPPVGTTRYNITVAGAGSGSLSPNYQLLGTTLTSLTWTNGISGGTYTIYADALNAGGAVIASATPVNVVAGTATPTPTPTPTPSCTVGGFCSISYACSSGTCAGLGGCAGCASAPCTRTGTYNSSCGCVLTGSAIC